MDTTTRYEPADRDDASNAPTLAEMLAARAQQRADHARENAARAQLSRQNDRREAVEYAQRWLADAVTPDLANALRALPACDDNRIDACDDYGDYNSPAIAALILLDVAGAGVDPDAHTTDYEDGRWRIQAYNYGTRGLVWSIYGPNNYQVEIANVYTRGPLDALILEALAAYPAWLASAEERRAEEEWQAQAKRQKQQRATPRRYVAIEPRATYLTESPGILATGNRLRVRVQDGGEENGLRYCDGELLDHTDLWLLITEDHGAQRLIPVNRVQDITPLPDLDNDPNDAA